MENNDTDIIITDTIDADQIEDGDQIIIDGEPLEGVVVHDDLEDYAGIRVTGFSWDSGDEVEHILPYDYRVDVWGL